MFRYRTATSTSKKRFICVVCLRFSLFSLAFLTRRLKRSRSDFQVKRVQCQMLLDQKKPTRGKILNALWILPRLFSSSTCQPAQLSPTSSMYSRIWLHPFRAYFYLGLILQLISKRGWRCSDDVVRRGRVTRPRLREGCASFLEVSGGAQGRAGEPLGS